MSLSKARRRVDAFEEQLDATGNQHHARRHWWAGVKHRARLRRRFERRLHWTYDEALAIVQYYEMAQQLRDEEAHEIRRRMADEVGLGLDDHRAILETTICELDGEPVPDDVAAACADIEDRMSAAEAALSDDDREILDAEREREIRWGIDDPVYRRAYAKFARALLKAEAEGRDEQLAAVLGSERGARAEARQMHMIGRGVLVPLAQERRS